MHKLDVAVLLVATVLGVLAAWLLLWTTDPYDIGVGWDSVAYLSAARNVVAGSGLVRNFLMPWNSPVNYYPFTEWPPLYSLLLAIPIAVSYDPMIAGRYLQALLYGMNVALVALLAYRFSGSKIGAAYAGVAALVGVPMLAVHSYLLSEALFLLLVTGSLWLVLEYTLHTRRSTLVGGALLAGLACLTRYVGVAFVVSLAISVLLTPARYRQRLRRGFLFSTVALMPLSLWMLRNWTVNLTLMGPRGASSRSLIENSQSALITLLSWVAPFSEDLRMRYQLMVLAPIFVLLLSPLALGDDHWLDRVKCWIREPIGVSMLVAVGHVVYLIAAQSVVWVHDAIRQRLMLPTFLPLLIAWVLLLTRSYNVLRMRPRIRSGFVLLATVTLALPARSTWYEVELWRDGSRQTHASPKYAAPLSILNQSHVDAGGGDIPLWSNDPSAAHFHTGRPARTLPSREDVLSGRVCSWLRESQAQAADVVLFDKNSSGRNGDLDGQWLSGGGCQSRSVARFTDIHILRLEFIAVGAKTAESWPLL